MGGGGGGAQIMHGRRCTTLKDMRRAGLRSIRSSGNGIGSIRPLVYGAGQYR